MEPEIERSEAIRKLRAGLPEAIETAILLAEYKKIQFDAYMKVGFTEQQAIQLCRG